MPAKKEPKDVTATSSGSVTHPDDGTLVSIVEGQTTLPDDDPVVGAFPEFFKTDDKSEEA